MSTSYLTRDISEEIINNHFTRICDVNLIIDRDDFRNKLDNHELELDYMFNLINRWNIVSINEGNVTIAYCN